MEQLLEWMEIIEDVRQEGKVRHKIKDILIIVLFATLANADTWEEIADFATWNEEYLKQYIYYISSLGQDMELFSRAVRGHWSIESMHWQPDVTFREDADTTAAQNQNIIRKWCLSMLKLLEIRGKKMSLKRKRFNISFALGMYIDELMKI